MDYLFIYYGAKKRQKSRLDDFEIQLRRHQNLRSAVKDIDLPSFRLHALKGIKPKRWSVTINGNAEVVDYEDYH